MRHQGARAWTALNDAYSQGKVPTGQLADAALVLVGGLLLIVPGFVSDLFGFLFLLPFTRPLGPEVHRVLRGPADQPARRTRAMAPGGPRQPDRGGDRRADPAPPRTTLRPDRHRRRDRRTSYAVRARSAALIPVTPLDTRHPWSTAKVDHGRLFAALERESGGKPVIGRLFRLRGGSECCWGRSRREVAGWRRRSAMPAVRREDLALAVRMRQAFTRRHPRPERGADVPPTVRADRFDALVRRRRPGSRQTLAPRDDHRVGCAEGRIPPRAGCRAGLARGLCRQLSVQPAVVGTGWPVAVEGLPVQRTPVEDAALRRPVLARPGAHHVAPIHQRHPGGSDLGLAER